MKRYIKVIAIALLVLYGTIILSFRLIADTPTLNSDGYLSCGRDTHRDYDFSKRNCFWKNYKNGKKVEFETSISGIDSGPIPHKVRIDSKNNITIYIDLTKDPYAVKEDQKIHEYSCKKMNQKLTGNLLGKYYFNFNGCIDKSIDMQEVDWGDV
ncbi:hypothetical protein [Paenibacillus eucommiae]|uniref:Uncharacterized protein n=1 Tax=Paenibacillus eucommiae TaxID=1355755 RepID=A0ABS4JAJ2_9BACL|nr:hypothetical protein [Paenibacillus eucommiae]MBP1996860.1 hypothetical protein [Paenibacillus eucommiae]